MVVEEEALLDRCFEVFKVCLSFNCRQVISVAEVYVVKVFILPSGSVSNVCFENLK